MSKRPVAFRVPRLLGDMVSHYFVTTSEDEARAMADTNQVEYEGLYLVGDRHTFDDAQSAQVTDAMVERAWAAIVGSDVAPICFQANIIRADLKIGLEVALAAQPPAATVETKSAPALTASPNPGERAPSSDAARAGADTHSSAGNGDDLSRRARELADEPVIGAEGRKLLRQMATEIEDLRHDIDRHIQIATDLTNEPQAVPEWLPIEAAPEGVPVWGWQPPQNGLHDCYGTVELVEQEDGAWFTHHDGEETFTPTRWMPANKPKRPHK